MEQIENIKELIEIMETAINSGDWRVDGACDPEMAMRRAQQLLRDSGYERDGLTGEEWIKY